MSNSTKCGEILISEIEKEQEQEFILKTKAKRDKILNKYGVNNGLLDYYCNFMTGNYENPNSFNPTSYVNVYPLENHNHKLSKNIIVEKVWLWEGECDVIDTELFHPNFMSNDLIITIGFNKIKLHYSVDQRGICDTLTFSQIQGYMTKEKFGSFLKIFHSKMMDGAFK